MRSLQRWPLLSYASQHFSLYTVEAQLHNTVCPAKVAICNIHCRSPNVAHKNTPLVSRSMPCARAQNLMLLLLQNGAVHISPSVILHIGAEYVLPTGRCMRSGLFSQPVASLSLAKFSFMRTRLRRGGRLQWTSWSPQWHASLRKHQNCAS